MALLLAVDAGDPERASGQERRREAAERRDDRRLDELQLAVEVGLAGGGFLRKRIAIPGWTALEHRREVHLVEGEADRRQEPVEKLARAAGERQPVPILVEPGRLADQDELRVGVPLPEDDLCPTVGKGTADAARGVRGDGVQGRCALPGVHAGNSTGGTGRASIRP